jgi:hypothetical protein
MCCLLLVPGLKSVEAEVDGVVSPCVVRALRLDNWETGRRAIIGLHGVTDVINPVDID